MRRSHSLLALLAILLVHLAALPLGAAERGVDGVLTEHLAPVVIAPPLSLSKSMAAAPLAILARAEFAVPSKIEAMNQWNAEGRQPLKVGFVRSLETSHLVSLFPDSPDVAAGVVEKTGDAVVWTSRIEVERAYRLRLHLSEVKLPAGAELWVLGAQGDVTRFGLELLRQEGDLWTPSVGGDVIHLQVRIPGASAQSGALATSFRVDSVAQIFRLDADGAAILDPAVTSKGTECLVDAACVDDSSLPGVDLYKEAVAHLQFMVGNDSFLCSGALMNDTDDSGFIPYLLTANHCFSTQSSASTLEAFFDYIASSCGGPWPNLSSRPRVVGATLLATTTSTDSTFVRLNNNPSGEAYYLGWTTAAVGSGTALGRLSHPMGWPQAFSATETYDPVGTCESVPTSRYIYSFPLLGATTGGSSGAPTVDDDFRVRGQLRGQCGPATEDPCNPLNDQDDGRFSNFFGAVAEYLLPEPQSCEPTDTVLCLRDGRFQIESGREAQDGYQPGIIVLNDDGSAVMRYVSASKWELILNIQPRGSFYWFSASGLTEGREYDISVMDVTTGQTWTFKLPESNPRVTNAPLSER